MTLKKQYDMLMKVMLIGDSNVGKSSIMYRFSEDEFKTTYISTIGIDFKLKTIELKGKKIKLQIWDTAGQERYQTITRNYYRNAMGIMLVYDITSSNTFDNISRWLSKIKQDASEDVLKMLIGNKSDMTSQRVISPECGQQIAIEHSIPFLETSAKTNTNIDKAFYYMAEAIMNNPVHKCDEPQTNILEELSQKKQQFKCC